MDKKTISTIKSAVNSASHILLCLHSGPDGDSFGANLAFFQALKQTRKKVTLIAGLTPLSGYLSFLPVYRHIKDTPSNLNAFDLFISLDSASLSVLPPFPSHLQICNIDHHQTNTNFGHINWVDPTFPATCQMLFSLFKKLKYPLSQNIAACLLTGIYTDTQFRFDGLTWQTFGVTAKLAKIYPKFPRLFAQIDNNNSPQTLQLAALYLSSTKTYLNNHLAIASISYQKLQKHKLNPQDAKGLDVTNMLKSVIGWYINVTLTEISPGQTKVSLRTQNPQKYNLAPIAQALGGGGHPAAAGALIDLPLASARRRLITTIKSFYPNL